MERIAIYGKGGIGKSTISTNISACLSLRGKKVLQVGCDPKRDSTKKLMGGRKIPTVMDLLKTQSDFVDIKELAQIGFNGVHCVEAGGPIPGTGCAGRGIAKMFELFDDVDLLHQDYDVILFDVLGDVVCGGFASPLRAGYGEKIFVVISEEIMSMYACNNICRAIIEYSGNGIYAGGIIVNARSNTFCREVVERFAQKINMDIVATIPRSDTIAAAEYKAMSLAEYAPNSEDIEIFYTLADDMGTIGSTNKKTPVPMDDEEFEDFFKSFEIQPNHQ